jgi:hypothetical protein
MRRGLATVLVILGVELGCDAYCQLPLRLSNAKV